MSTQKDTQYEEIFKEYKYSRDIEDYGKDLGKGSFGVVKDVKYKNKIFAGKLVMKDTSEEDLMNEQYNSVNNIVQRGLDFIALRDQQKSQNKNNELDDTVSMNSKVMDNNLMKNNRGLKLPMIIGTQDFKENDFIGLVLDDEEEEEENFNNEIRNDQGVVIPKEGAQGEEKENIMNNNNMNNPEEFHNMVQQQMGKPIITQNMFENIDDDNKGENEFINPAMATMNVENDVNIGGLGSLLRKTSLQPNMQNMNMINPNNINNMKKTNTQLNDMRKSRCIEPKIF